VTASNNNQTATLASVASSASSTSLFSAGDQVQGRTVFNDSTAVLYVAFAGTASETAYTVQLAAGGFYEFPQPPFAGAVSGIWASANGNARTTQW
jgi:hypothetical protein